MRLGTGPGDRMVQLNRTAYAQSIRIEPVKVSPGAASVTVYSQDPQAGPIEDGSAEMNLHDVLAYAPKAKRSKAGHRYLSIPFRWATTAPGGPGGQRFQSSTNVLPKSVLDVMKSKRISRVTGTYQLFDSLRWQLAEAAETQMRARGQRPNYIQRGAP